MAINIVKLKLVKNLLGSLGAMQIKFSCLFKYSHFYLVIVYYPLREE